MDIASRCAGMSHAVRKKVGCIIVKNESIISHGWNGTPKGTDNCCEYEVETDQGRGTKLVTHDIVIHAESNALNKWAKSTSSANDSTMYVTLEPCINCAKQLHGSGISRLIFKESYNSSGSEFLKNVGIEVIKL